MTPAGANRDLYMSLLGTVKLRVRKAGQAGPVNVTVQEDEFRRAILFWRRDVDRFVARQEG
jgi:hypothetical protein